MLWRSVALVPCWLVLPSQSCSQPHSVAFLLFQSLALSRITWQIRVPHPSPLWPHLLPSAEFPCPSSQGWMWMQLLEESGHLGACPPGLSVHMRATLLSLVGQTQDANEYLLFFRISPWLASTSMGKCFMNVSVVFFFFLPDA